MIPFAQAVDTFLNRLIDDAFKQLHGLPEDALNDWRPRQEMADINTFFALATHLAGAGEYWVLHAAGGQPLDRDRPAEFRARGNLEELKARYARLMEASAKVLRQLDEGELARLPDLGETFAARGERPWTVAECLMHAVEHTAVHVGHLQIQRQLWDAEVAASA